MSEKVGFFSRIISQRLTQRLTPVIPSYFAVRSSLAYATWSVVIFTLLLLNNTTSHAGKVSDERPAAQAEVTSDEPAQTPTPDPTPTAEGRFDRMYKLFHLGS